MIFLGIDLGSSSIKVSLFDAEAGKVLGQCHAPEQEQKIETPQPGWAEQKPELWWNYFVSAYRDVVKKTHIDTKKIQAIGISYQMHGLVTIDKQGQCVRPAIIWCDSRAVSYGENAFDGLGHDYALKHLLNSPGNFTAAKLAWVKDNEKKAYDRIRYWMLPGDYLAYRLTGEANTTNTGLSEGIFWDFEERKVNKNLLSYFGFNEEQVPPVVPAIGYQGQISPSVATELGMNNDVRLTYRAGDQPNNAFSLHVVHPGEVAATAGTSGVIYAVTDKNLYDPESRINTFLHVNDGENSPRNGILICINGTGVLYSWLKKILDSGGTTITYDLMNELSGKVNPGADGLRFYPFGNGSERVLGNRMVQAHLNGLDFNRHGAEHLLRAGMEGIIYALMIGFDVLNGLNYESQTIKAGHANLFLSKQFREIFANVTKTPVELYDTDGAAGAARGAALGFGFYSSIDEPFESLQQIDYIEPDKEKMNIYDELYEDWKQKLPL